MSFDTNRTFENVSEIVVDIINGIDNLARSYQNFMSRVVREELREMDVDIALQERIYAEIESEILQWLVDSCKCEVFV